ncbi:MAG: hypothetical protein Q7R92_00870 [bacterium]|nr:hypothetical protein [bacterium]
MADKKITINDLAVMVKQGFDGVTKEFRKVSQRMDTLEQGQEAIKLRLDNVAYRFELVELQKRVEKIEKKVGVN